MKTSRLREKGQAILEMAVMLPVFCLIGFGLLDMVFAMERAANVEYIANETARCQAIQGIPCVDQSPTQYALSLGKGLKMYPPQLVIASATCVEGLSCSATVTYYFQAIGIWFPSITITRTSTAALPPIQP